MASNSRRRPALLGAGSNENAVKTQIWIAITISVYVHTGKAEPSFIVSHHLPLTKAPEAYKHFDARENGWAKVVLKPAA